MTSERLFVGMFPACIVYADFTREKAGDYARLATLPYGTLELAFERDCPLGLRDVIERHAVQYRAGDVLEISTSGQTVRLGTERADFPDVLPGEDAAAQRERMHDGFEDPR